MRKEKRKEVKYVKRKEKRGEICEKEGEKR